MARGGIKSKIAKIKKRNGRVVAFSPSKIERAIKAAFKAAGKDDVKEVRRLTKEVVLELEKRFNSSIIPEVEQVQDIVEQTLLRHSHDEVHNAYTLYRQLHQKLRSVSSLVDADELTEKYLNQGDWRVKENANMTYSLQGLNNHVASIISANFWLNKIYSREVRKAHRQGDLHIHDLSSLSAYCTGWDLKDFLIKGFGGVAGKVNSAPPKHLSSALGQIVNFMYTIQGEVAGAVAVSNFDTYLAPFVRYDGLTYKQTKQALQEFVFNMNVPTRVGFQTPFSNISLDIHPTKMVGEETVVIAGQPTKDKYKDFQKEMDMINRAFAETMMEGDAQGRVFTFPIPTYSITKDFDWDNKNLEPVWEMTRKYGIPYFSNFVNSDMDPDDARSMCPLAGDEKVLIRSSRGRGLEYSTIRNVYEGNAKRNDYQIFSDGRFIAGRFNKFTGQKIIKVTLANGHSVRMSENHLNFALRNDNEITIKGKELMEGDFLPYSLNKYQGEGGNYDLGYFVGAFAGDGSFDGNTSVVFSLEGERKKDLIDRLIKISQKYFGAHYSLKDYSKTRLVTLKVHSRAAVGLCRDFVQGKEREKHYRARLFDMSEQFREGVIAGHYATDGGNRHRIYTSSKNMVESLNMLAATLGTTTSVYKDDRPGRLSDEPNWAVLVYRLNRKNYGDFWCKKFGRLWVRIKKIEKVSRKMVAYCFEVNSGEPIFTIGTTGILTHNCRLRLDNRELRRRGGLFAANPLTGSLGVVTINLPRIGYLARVESKTEGFAKRKFFTLLGHLMDLAKDSLVIKREAVEKFTHNGLYPYCRHYLSDIYQRNGVYWRNHFNTIGLNGMNEALVNLMGKNIADPEGQAFALEVMDYMREKILIYQQETGEMFNLEATPAESTAYRFARLDKEQFPKIICANEKDYQEKKEAPFYTNSTHLPVDYTTDLFEALDHQDELQCKYTGGCIEEGNRVLTDKGLMPIEEIVEKFNKLRPLRVVSYHSGKEVSEWDEVLEAVEIEVERERKVRIEGERGLDIVTSDWHPFFVMKKRRVTKKCPICDQPVINVKAFAVHLRYHPDCRKKYHQLFKYQVVTRRADELKKGDYILQNNNNILPNKGELENQLMWLIGFYIGDGCLSEFVDNRGGNKLKKYKLRFFSEHQEAMDKVVQVLNDNFGCLVNVIRNDKRSDRLLEVSTSRKEAVDFFLKKGFLPGSKVYNVGVPKKVKDVIGNDNVFSFLSGLMDSDGHLSRRDGSFEYYTVSPKLADDLLEIFTLAGILISKSEKPTKRENEKDIWRLTIPAYEMTRISNRLTNTFNSSRINNQLSRRIKRQLPVVRVKRTTRLKPKENKLFYDLMTKKNHNYLAGKDCLVFVHNTVLHGFLGESLPNTESVKNLLRKVTANYKLPYFSITPTFSVCPKHGYLPGEWQFCPKCDEEIGYQEK